MIFIDADAYISIYLPTDVHHSRAIALSRRLKEEKEELVTSWDVIDEAATKLSFLSTKSVAARFLRDRRSSNEQVVYVDPNRAARAIKLFLKHASKRISLTDCINMVIARELNMDTFFSFDRHYHKNGFRLLGASQA